MNDANKVPAEVQKKEEAIRLASLLLDGNLIQYLPDDQVARLASLSSGEEKIRNVFSHSKTRTSG